MQRSSFPERLLRRVLNDCSPDRSEVSSDLRVLMLIAARERDQALRDAQEAGSFGDLLHRRRLWRNATLLDLERETTIGQSLLSEIENRISPPWTLGVEDFLCLLESLAVPIRHAVSLIRGEPLDCFLAPLPAHTRAEVTTRAKARAMTEQASLLLQAKVLDQRRRDFVGRLASYID